VKIWSKLQNSFIVEYKSSWIEEVDENERNEKIPVLFIQMTLGYMSLEKAIEKIDDQLQLSKEFFSFGVYLVCELFVEILQGVEYLHKYPIIHRDLNLQNILLSDLNEGYGIKICDFGLSTLHEDKYMKVYSSNKVSYPYQHTGSVGTIEFAAPEVLNGENYDTSSDMYSLGVIFSKLLCLPDILVDR